MNLVDLLTTSIRRLELITQTDRGSLSRYLSLQRFPDRSTIERLAHRCQCHEGMVLVWLGLAGLQRVYPKLGSEAIAKIDAILQSTCGEAFVPERTSYPQRQE